MSIERWKKLDAASDLEDISEQVNLWFKALEIQAEEWQVNVFSRLIKHQCHMVEPNLNAPEPRANKLEGSNPEIVVVDEVEDRNNGIYDGICPVCAGAGLHTVYTFVTRKGGRVYEKCPRCNGRGTVREPYCLEG